MATESTFYDKNWTVLQKLKYLEQWFNTNSLDPSTITFSEVVNGSYVEVTLSGTTYDGTSVTLNPINVPYIEGPQGIQGEKGDTGATGSQGLTGVGIYYTTDPISVGTDVTTDLASSSITIPTGYGIVVGSLILDYYGVVGQVTAIGGSTVTVKYLEVLQNGNVNNCYRHNIAVYFNRDEMDCAAISFTLLNQSDSINYEIPVNITYAVGGIVYPNSSTAYVATRLTTSTSGDDTIYTIGYWDYPNASQLTFEFTSNDDILIEHTVELLAITAGEKGDKGDTGAQGEQGEAATVEVGTVATLAAGNNAYVTNVGTDTNAVLNFGIPQGEQGASGSDLTAGTGVDITDNTISVKTSSVALESENRFYTSVSALSFTQVSVTALDASYINCIKLYFTITMGENTVTCYSNLMITASSSITSLSSLAATLYSYGYKGTSLLSTNTLALPCYGKIGGSSEVSTTTYPTQGLLLIIAHQESSVYSLISGYLGISGAYGASEQTEITMVDVSTSE